MKKNLLPILKLIFGIIIKPFLSTNNFMVYGLGIIAALTVEYYTKNSAFMIGLLVVWFYIADKITAEEKSYHKTIHQTEKLQRGSKLFSFLKKAGQSHGSASFAHFSDLKKQGAIGNKGYIVGKFDGKFIRFNSPGHMITLAPTRSGKGVGHVIPNLLSHPGSVVVNDIKGENYAVTHRKRAEFSKVMTFAPFMKGSNCYNPIDFIRTGTEDELDDVRLMADMMITIDPNSSDTFWPTEAKNLVTALVLHVANARPPVLRNIGEVRYLLMQSSEDFQFTIKEMLKSKSEHVRRMAASISATEQKVMASILSTAKSQTAVWDSPRLNAITGRSDFQLKDIKEEPTSLYIIIPPEYLETYKPVVRIMIGLTIAAMTRTQKKPKDNVLFLIDEFPALGYMEIIETGIGYLAGYGVTLWTFIQDLSQLKALYKKWETFISNCAVRVAFGTNDFDTAKVLSDMLGNTTIRISSSGDSSGGKSTNYSETSRLLMTPDEIMRMPFDSQLIFFQGQKPVVAEKVMYFSEPAFKGSFDKWEDS